MGKKKELSLEEELTENEAIIEAARLLANKIRPLYKSVRPNAAWLALIHEAAIHSVHMRRSLKDSVTKFRLCYENYVTLHETQGEPIPKVED